ncbi:MAG: nucleotidyltransferase family protein [Sphingopyxis sp.]|uniref:nucleotidyltransferase domain-containing protein n=1 Tax=Sphingopyxis sp. TaxID=1908224 RepID=UPI003D811456
MTRPAPHLLLLDMMATRRAPTSADFAALNDVDWQRLRDMALQHRLTPLLHHRFVAAGRSWPVPAEIAAEWERLYRRAATRSLVMQHALVTVQALLQREGIASAALKGAWLAWQAYEVPALRPMRDIDLLVADEHAERAHALLIAEGARPGPKSHVPIIHAREHHKHMPPIVFGEGRVCFEIHWRLARPEAGEDKAKQRAESAALLARRVATTVGGQPVMCLDPTDTLLHLIVHAAYDHRLDNGPMILSDLAATLAAAAIDWPRFWAAAEAHGQAPGAHLLFALAAEYHAVEVQWPGGIAPAPPPVGLIEAARALLVKDMAARTEVYFETALADAPGIAAKSALLRDRAFPPRHIVAHYAGRPIDGRGLWFWYAVRLVDHARRFLWKRFDRGRRDSVDEERALGAWLDAAR